MQTNQRADTQCIIGCFFDRLVAAAGRYSKNFKFTAGSCQNPRNGIVMTGIAVENDGDFLKFRHRGSSLECGSRVQLLRTAAPHEREDYKADDGNGIGDGGGEV